MRKRRGGDCLVFGPEEESPERHRLQLAAKLRMDPASENSGGEQDLRCDGEWLKVDYTHEISPVGPTENRLCFRQKPYLWPLNRVW